MNSGLADFLADFLADPCPNNGRFGRRLTDCLIATIFIQERSSADPLADVTAASRKSDGRTAADRSHSPRMQVGCGVI
jgi:hypothetical protein